MKKLKPKSAFSSKIFIKQLQKFRKVLILLFFIFIITLFFWRLFTILPQKQDGYLKIKGTIVENPRKYNNLQYFVIDGYSVKTDIEEDLSYADIVIVEGEVANKRFNYPIITITGHSSWRKYLYTLRQSLYEQILIYFPQPEAALLGGITLGIKEELPEDFRNALIATGTIHVVVVSGYNISVIAGILLLLARFIRRQYAVILSLIAITFYTLLVGAEPPAVRAAIMGTAGFVALGLGRQRWSFYSLMLAGVIMVFLNPAVLKNIGFQLSFMATAGIIIFQNHIHVKFKSLPKPFAEDFSTSLSAIILVLPIIFYHFGTVSLVAPLVNALVLWTIPISTVLGFVFLIVSFVIPPLAQLLSWVIWALLFIFSSIVTIFNRISVSNLVFSKEQIFPLFFYYGALIALIWYIRNGRTFKKK